MTVEADGFYWTRTERVNGDGDVENGIRQGY